MEFHAQLTGEYNANESIGPSAVEALLALNRQAERENSLAQARHPDREHVRVGKGERCAQTVVVHGCVAHVGLIDVDAEVRRGVGGDELRDLQAQDIGSVVLRRVTEDHDARGRQLLLQKGGQAGGNA